MGSAMLRSINNGLLHRSQTLRTTTTHSTLATPGNGTDHRHISDSFEHRMFGGTFQDGKLERAAEFFEDLEDKLGDDFCFRDDITITEDMNWTTYEPEELDLRKSAKQPYVATKELNVSTKEALSCADFRNVRFLASFITEAGIVIKRSQTGITAKAQKKGGEGDQNSSSFWSNAFHNDGDKVVCVWKKHEG